MKSYGYCKMLEYINPPYLFLSIVCFLHFCINHSEIYVEDVDVYADWNKITSTWLKNTEVSGRNIYSLPSNFTEDISIEFKFKENVPSIYVFGLGLYQSPYTSKGEFIKLSASQGLGIYYSDSYQDNNEFPLDDRYQNVTKDTIFKIETENLHLINWYLNGNRVAYRNTKTSIPLQLRIDDFFSSPTVLDYVKIRKL